MNERPASPWRIEDVDVPGYLAALDVDAAQLAAAPRDLSLLERLHRALSLIHI